MARKIFIAATDQNCGKTTTSLSLLHLALKKYQRVGFIKPLGPKPIEFRGISVDKDPALMAEVFGLEEQLPFMSPVVLQRGSTRRVLDGEISPAELEEKIIRAFAELEKSCDLIIIEGAGHTGVGSVIKLSNARIARMLDAPVLMVSGGGIGSVVDAVYMNLALFRQEGVGIRAVLANKLVAEKREVILAYLRRAFADEPFKVIGGFNYHPILANPTLRRVSLLLDLPLHGNQQETNRIVHHVQIGAPATQRVAELLQENSLLIVTSSRDELLVTLANLYQIPEYRARIIGLVIPGLAPVSRITQLILERSNIPYMRTQSYSTAALYQIITEDVSKTTAEDTQKLELIRSLAEKRLDFDEIDALFAPD